MRIYTAEYETNFVIISEVIPTLVVRVIARTDS